MAQDIKSSCFGLIQEAILLEVYVRVPSVATVSKLAPLQLLAE